MEKFRGMTSGVLLATDLLSRGVDVPDVDWVVQFDAPQDPEVFVHRIGRTGRAGASGRTLLLLAPSEHLYTSFLEKRKLLLAPFETSVKGSSTCTRLRNRLEADRDALLRAIKAFVAFVRAYQNHKLSFVFPFADLDLGGLATQLGLLRLPRMKEILGRKIKGFTASDVHPITVPFLNRKREKQRQEQLKVDLAKREEERAEREKARNKPAKVEKERTRTEKRAAKKANVQDHWDELAREERLAKKLKQKKISVKEYEKLLRKNGGGDDDDDEAEAGG